jgi:phage tail-like protein
MSDPYETSRFLVFLGTSTVPIPEVCLVTSLIRSTAAVDESTGGGGSAPRLVPGRSSWAPITMGRPIGPDTTFEDWANEVFALESGVPIGGQSFRKTVRLHLLDEAGVVVRGYNILNAWVSEYEALPDLDSDANALALEHIVIQHDGWERDTTIVAPAGT